MNIEQQHLQVGDKIHFCPDLDRGATFKISDERQADKPKTVLITLKYIDGRWAPGDGRTDFSFPVPWDYTKEDIECAWFGIPNFKRSK